MLRALTVFVLALFMAVTLSACHEVFIFHHGGHGGHGGHHGGRGSGHN